MGSSRQGDDVVGLYWGFCADTRPERSLRPSCLGAKSGARQGRDRQHQTDRMDSRLDRLPAQLNTNARAGRFERDSSSAGSGFESQGAHGSQVREGALALPHSQRGLLHASLPSCGQPARPGSLCVDAAGHPLCRETPGLGWTTVRVVAPSGLDASRQGRKRRVHSSHASTTNPLTSADACGRPEAKRHHSNRHRPPTRRTGIGGGCHGASGNPQHRVDQPTRR